MATQSRFWTTTRTLFWIGVVAGGLALYGLGLFRPIERWLFEARVTWSGYDGCLCEDCRRALFGYAKPHDIVLFGTDFPDGRLMLQLAFTPIAFICWATAGMIWIQNRRARRALEEHCCAACGYDLRGLRPGAVCPECGD